MFKFYLITFLLSVLLAGQGMCACSEGEIKCFDSDTLLGVCFNSSWIKRSCPRQYQCSPETGKCLSLAAGDGIVAASVPEDKEYLAVAVVFDGDTSVQYDLQLTDGATAFATINLTSNRSYFKHNDWLLTLKYRSDLIESIVKVEGCDFVVYNDLSPSLNPTLAGSIAGSFSSPPIKTLLIKTRKTVDYGLEYLNGGTQASIFIQLRLANPSLFPQQRQQNNLALFSDFRFGPNSIDGSHIIQTGGQASGVSEVVASAVTKSTTLNCKIDLEFYDDEKEYLLMFTVEGDTRPRADLAIKFRIPIGQHFVSQISDDITSPTPNPISIDKASGIAIFNLDPVKKSVKIIMRRDQNLVLPSDLILIDQSVIDLKGQPIELPLFSTINIVSDT